MSGPKYCLTSLSAICTKFFNLEVFPFSCLVHLEFLNTNMIGNFQTHVYGRPAMFSRALIFATAFMSFFSVVIALFKVTVFSFEY